MSSQAKEHFPLAQEYLFEEIGAYIGLNMDYYAGKNILFKDMELIVFQPSGIQTKSVYTLNLKTLHPTRSSPNQSHLPEELKELCRRVYPHLFKTQQVGKPLNPSSPPPAPTK